MVDLVKEINNTNNGKINIFSVGQAGYIIKFPNNKTLGIDLYLSDCVARVEEDTVGYKRLLPKLINPEDIDLDYIVCSHYHRDHFDIDSVPTLMKNANSKLYCAKDCLDDVINLKIDKLRVVYMEPGQTFEEQGFVLHIINCDHGTGAPLAIGLIIETEGKRILIVVDRKSEYLSKGAIDVLIAPINGMYGNLNEEDCAKLANELNAKLVIPSHYGMFAAHRGDIGLFHNIMDQKYPNNKYLIMCQGEKFSI